MLRARNLIWEAALRHLRPNGAFGSRALSSGAAQALEKDESRDSAEVLVSRALESLMLSEVDEAAVSEIVESLRLEARVTGELMQPWRGRLGSPTVNRILKVVSSEKAAMGFLEWASAEELQPRDRVVAHALVLQRLARAGMGDEVRELLKKMRESGLLIKKQVFSEIVTLLLRSGHPVAVAGVFEDMVESHMGTFRVEVVKLLYEEGRWDVASSLLEAMNHQEVSSKEVLVGFTGWIARKNDSLGLQALVKALVKALKTEPEFDAVLEVLCREFRLEHACNLLDRMGEAGVTPGLGAYGRLMDGLVRCSMFDHACALLDVMAEQGCVPESSIYNKLLEGLSRTGQVKRALEMFETMVGNGCSPDLSTYNTIMSGVCLRGEASKAGEVLERMIAAGFVPDASTYSYLVQGHCRAGRMKAAIVALEEMLSRGWMPERGIFQGIVGSLCKEKDVEGVKRFLRDHKSRFDLDSQGYSIVMGVYGKFGRLEEARELLQEMRDRRVSPTLVTMNSFMFALCQRKLVDEALEFMPGTMAPDLYTYTILIGGLCDAGRIDEACSLKEKMIRENCKPDKITHGILVAGLLRAGRRAEAEELKKDMIAAEIPVAQRASGF